LSDFHPRNFVYGEDLYAGIVVVCPPISRAKEQKQDMEKEENEDDDITKYSFWKLCYILLP